MTDEQILEYSNQIATELDHLGYSPAEITAFIAGARLAGHLQRSGSEWRLRHCLQQYLKPAAPIDGVLEKHDPRGYRNHTRPRPNKPIKCQCGTASTGWTTIRCCNICGRPDQTENLPWHTIE